MKYSLFPGCIAKNMYPSIEKSTEIIFRQLGIDLIRDAYTCCPAPGVIRSYDFDSWLVIAARNLATAEKSGSDLMAICNGCYGTLHAANQHLIGHQEALKMVNEKMSTIGVSYSGKTKVVHFVDVIGDMIPQIRENVKVELGLEVAIHYGCHYLKPSIDPGQNPEKPEILERVIQAIGCESVEFPEKLSCCGAGGGVWSGDEQVSLRMLEKKLRFIKESGADCILDVCPFCHLQLDQGQKRLKARYDVPVLHLSQLIGLSFGTRDKILGLHTHMVSTRDIARKAKKARREIALDGD